MNDATLFGANSKASALWPSAAAAREKYPLPAPMSSSTCINQQRLVCYPCHESDITQPRG